MAQFSTTRQKSLYNKDLHEVVMIADKDGNLLNTSGAASNIPLAAGDLSGYSHINKFGATDGDVTSGTIWDGNNGSIAYPYPANGLVSVSSATEVGEEVIVDGLDADYNLQSETIEIGATGTLIFSRVFRVKMSTITNLSDIEIDLGAVLAAKILAGLAQTLMAIYTVPAGKTAYILGAHFGSDKASTNSRMTYRMFTREILNGGVFRILANLNAAGGQNVDITYPVPLIVPEKHDIQIDLLAGQATQVSATFDIILVDNI